MNVKQTDAVIAAGWGVMSVAIVYDGLFDALGGGTGGAIGSPWIDWLSFSSELFHLSHLAVGSTKEVGIINQKEVNRWP